MGTVFQQVRNNLVAIISLTVALTGLGYTTWRNERTESNRNVRAAGFEMLSEIGSLQQIVFYAHYVPKDARGEKRMGWADMLTILDLAELMSPEISSDAKSLYATWSENAGGLGKDDAAHQRIDESIDVLRQATLARLRTLN